ncbi:MAG: PQQ-binding-like beta-propeller repeat protein [Anaerolineae bacterium]|nr:PQQ-binding-like beta-propeller repeat protein [Anaerolineae bacterium]NIN97946.1 PQQ-binding-like beta-propeller repeat protein [Anaerolineae bacterium]NIQ80913.1 PQQ-binding-like beta-propeller repeat protein [Anaerolineae bacterium]
MTIGRQGSGDGEFINPQGLALDGEGNLYVADTGNSRVQVFDAEGNFFMTIADQRFTGPRYVAVDDVGRVYVTDAAERVHVFNGRGDPVQSFGQAGSLPSQFTGVADLAVDTAGELYVVDGGNSRVQKFSLLSGLLFTLGDEGEAAELLDRPEGIGLDSEGNVHVADAGNRRIQEYSPGGTYIRSIAGEVNAPRDVALDIQGNLYVSDGGQKLVQILDGQGQLLMEVGKGRLDDPWGIAVDGQGRIFVADAGNHRVQVFAPVAEVPTPVLLPSPEASPTPTLPPIEGAAPWPMYGGDAQHSGRSEVRGPASPNLKWLFRAGLVANSPAVGADGTVYFGSLDGNLYALDRDGTELWRADFGQISGVPALGETGTVYAGAASPIEEMFYAFDRYGRIRWAYHLEFYVIESSPIVGPDGSIYLAASNPQTGGGTLVALNPDGSERWRYDVGSRVPFSPALGPDGTIYVGARNGNLYAVDADGRLKWEKSLLTVASSAAVGDDGTIYLGTGADYQALNPADGSPIWTFSLADGEAESTPALGAGGRVYLTSNGNELYALNPDGTTAWTFAAEQEGEREVHFRSPITLDGARVLYAGTREGDLFAVNPDGTLRWRLYLPEGGMVLVGPAIGADGTLYVGAGSNLYAVGQ